MEAPPCHIQERKLHAKTSAKRDQDLDRGDIIGGGDLYIGVDDLRTRKMGKKKSGSKSCASAAAGANRPTAAATTTAAATPHHSVASSRSASPGTVPPTQTPGRGTPSIRTPAARPDPSNSRNRVAAIAEGTEPSDNSRDSEQESPDPDGQGSVKGEAAEEGEVGTTTPRTIRKEFRWNGASLAVGPRAATCNIGDIGGGDLL